MGKLKKKFYDKKMYNNKLIRLLAIISHKFVSLNDARIDRKVCKMSLHKYVPSKYRESHGATGSTSTEYSVLKDIIDVNKLNENSKFIDVGCGKGRVLASLLHRKVTCSLVGIELNEEVADIAKSWSKDYPNVEIRCQNAFDLDMNEYTDIFLARPFELDVFKEFLKKMEQDIKHEVRVYMYVDQFYGDIVDERPGWELEKRRIAYFRKGFYVNLTPQRYSVYKYIPSK